MKLDLSQINDEKIATIDEGPAGRVEPGKCHCRVDSWGEGGAKGGDHIVKFEVLAHDKGQGQVGRIHWEYFSSKSTAVWRLLRLAVVTGLTTKETLRRCKETGEDPEIDFEQLPGRQLYIELDEEEYEGKKKVRIKGGGEMLALDDERAKGYPTHKKMLERAANRPKPAPAREPVAAAASDDPYA